MEITTEYSSWYLILCAVLAGLYAFFLYGKNKQILELPIWVVRLLSFLRFVTVFILAALLLNPFIQKWSTQTEDPIIIIAQDISASIINNTDSVYYKTNYLEELDELKKTLSGNYEIVSMAFGSDVRDLKSNVLFDQKRTNYEVLFDEIEARYAGDNIGAVILASDGLVNSGANPSYYNFKQDYPVYTVGLGDTTHKSDISIAEVRNNDIAYLGNSFPVEVSVSASLLTGKHANLKVYSNGKLMDERSLNITKTNQLFTERFEVEAIKEGTQGVIIKVTQFENELNTVNNTKQVLINVLDNRDKILIIANAPHPDVAAIRSALSQKESLQVDVTIASNFKHNLEAYNLIIAHGFGSTKNTVLWNQIWTSKIPVWLMLYGNTNLNGINQFNPGFETSSKGVKVNRISPDFNADFNAFKLSESTRNYLRNVPPVSSPYGEITKFSESQTMLYQRLGSVTTEYPLMYFGTHDEVKTAWFFGDGIWRWKMFDYQKNNSHDNFNEIILKTTQFLSVKEDKSRFRMKSSKRFAENIPITFFAEFYDKSYEITDKADITLVVTDEENNEFVFAFVANRLGYSLDMGKLPPGDYSYVAKAVEGSDIFTKRGSFIVEAVNIEWATLSANHDVLKEISSNTGGEFFFKEQIKDLAVIFEDKTKFPSISYSNEKKQSILHYKWIFALILSLLTIEWVFRKYKGRY